MCHNKIDEKAVSMKRKQSLSLWSVVGFICAAFAIVAAITTSVIMTQRTHRLIDSFQSCKDAGGAIAESYPEQCYINGKSFTNEQQSLDNGSSEYIGLSEREALDQASRLNKTARVVSRDGEALPVTMDFMAGRLNLYIKDGKVLKVQVEGDER